MRNFKSILLSLLFFACVNTAAVDCSDVLSFDASGGISVSAEKQWALCDNDVATNALNLIMQGLYNTSGIQAVYQALDVPAVPQNTYTKLNGNLLLMLCLATIKFCLIGIVVVRGSQLGGDIIKGLKSDNLGKFFQDQDGWSATLSLLVLSILMFPLDGIMIGQIMVVGLALFSFKLANFFLGAVISAFSFQLDIDESVAKPSLYMQDGVHYANALTQVMIAQRQMSSALGKVNSSTTNADMNETPDDLKTVQSGSTDGVVESPLSWEKEFPVSVDDYLLNAISPSIVATFASPKTNKVLMSYGVHANPVTEESVTKTVGASFKISMSQAIKRDGDGISRTTKTASDLAKVGAWSRIGLTGKLVESYYDPIYSEGNAFTSVNFGSVQSLSSTSDLDMVRNLISTGLTKDFSKLTTAEASATNVKTIAEKLVKFAKEYAKKKNLGDDFEAQKKLEQEYIRASQAYLLGYYDHTSANDLRAKTYVYNPLREDSIPNSTSNGLIRNLHYAQKASTEFVKNRCTEYAFSDQHSSQIFSEVRLYDAYINTPNAGMSAHEAASNHSTQCLAYTKSGTVELLLDKALATRIMALLKEQAAIGASDAEIRKTLTNERHRYVLKLNESAKNVSKNKMRIALFYSNVAAVVKTAGYTVTANFEANAVDAVVLQELRENGALVIPAYFARLATLVTRIATEFDSFELEAAAAVDLDKELLITGIDDVNKEALNLFNNAFIPMGSGLVGFEDPTSEYVPFTNDEARETAQTDDSTVDFVNQLIDIIIPAQDILVSGFGLDQEGSDGTLAGGLGRCAETGKCYEFTQHPMATLAMFGQEVLFKGLAIILLNELMHALSDVTDMVDEMIDSFGSATDQKAAASTLKLAAGMPFKIVTAMILVGTAVTDMLRPFAGVFVVTGVLLAYILPLFPVIGWLMASLKGILEILMLIVFYPVFLLFAFIKFGGKTIISTQKFVGLHISIVIQPTLLLVSYLFFFLSIYMAIYIINTCFGQILTALDDSGAGSLTLVVSKVIVIAAMLYLYFKKITMIATKCLEIPELIMSYIGVQGLSLKSVSDVEALIGGSVLGNKVAEMASSSAGAVSNMTAKKSRDVAVDRDRESMQEMLKQEGLDINLSEIREKYQGGKR